ncbi:hypothetical protein, partial [Lacrimispora sp.]|uniref:hypothetical protein n=1 Tax=Lacrimispora sp. TaxID=2719234 RepID=UPI0028A8D5EE
MTQFKRFAAFLLCFLMIFPTQELMILAETTSMEYERIEEMPSSDITEDGADRIEETQPSETIEDGADRVEEAQPSETIEDGTDRVEETLPSETVEDGTDRIEETLPLEPIEDGTDRIEETLPLEPIEGEGGRIKETLPLEPLDDNGYAIYWNPGGQLPEELASASNATATASKATPSRAKMGKDSASGLSPAKPVKTLKKAIERAENLMEKEGLDPSDITIYAMNPMEVADGELYVLNAGNIRIASWPERPYESDALFYVNGGQLTLTNVLLEAEEPDYDPDETGLVYVRGGVLQMGQNVNINGCVVMDYCSEQEDIEWKEDTASPSNAADTDNTAAENERIEKTLPLQPLASTTSQAKAAGEAAFDIDNYALDTDEDNVELIVDKMSVSTWRDPIIELMEGFDGGNGEYLLELRDDDKSESRELVTTLYADDATEEEFLGHFTLAESDNWNLEVETEAAAQLRDTGSVNKIMSRSFAFEADTLTSKTLVASRSLGEAKVIYWNPGAAMTIDGEIYPAGDDVLYDGSNPRAPLKTW